MKNVRNKKVNEECKGIRMIHGKRVSALKEIAP